MTSLCYYQPPCPRNGKALEGACQPQGQDCCNHELRCVTCGATGVTSWNLLHGRTEHDSGVSKRNSAPLQGALFALALVLLAGCSSPTAPTLAPERSSKVVDTLVYLVPLKHPSRTGAHPQSLWWDGRNLTIVKGYDSSHLEAWEFDGGMWRHIYDRTDGTGTAYRLLPGDWIPAHWRVGDSLNMRNSEIVRFDMSGKFLGRTAFPYTMRFIAFNDAVDVGGIIGETSVIDVEYQPLQVNGQPHAHPNKETFRFALGYGLVGWRAEWHMGGQWLTFTEAFGPPVPPGFMVELPRW